METDLAPLSAWGPTGEAQVLELLLASGPVPCGPGPLRAVLEFDGTWPVWKMATGQDRREKPLSHEYNNVK